MLFEVLVLDGGDGGVQYSGTLLVGHQDPALQCEAAGELAVIRIDFRDHVRPVSFQCADFRQVAGANKQQAAAGTQRDRAKDEKNEGHAVNQFPTAQTQCNRWQAQH